MIEKNSKMQDKFKKLKIIILILAIFSTLLCVALIVVSVISVYDECDPTSANSTDLEVFKGGEQINIDQNKLSYNIKTKHFSMLDSSNRKLLSGSIGNSLDLSDYKEIKSEKSNNGFSVHYTAKSRAANIKLDVTSSMRIKQKADGIECKTYKWSVNNDPNERYAQQEFEDCFSLGSDYWFGGAESFDQQYWPINKQDFKTYLPYLTGLFSKWSSILERYWLSSSGVAIIVQQYIPLFVLKNQTSICLLASAKEPYNRDRIINLEYDICKSDSVASEDYLNKLQLYVINNYFSKPSGVPDKLMIKSPIWSTWANFKARINDVNVKEYALDILANNYTHSQIEIDDKWQTEYGDFTFDTKKFPNIANFITELNGLGFRTTLWVHPFANIVDESFYSFFNLIKFINYKKFTKESKNFLVQAFNFFEVRSPDGLHPGLTSWWRGLGSVILDTTNPNATNWFVSELEKVRSEAKIDSFKFDAGEIEWLPKFFWLVNDSITPDQYSINYARMAARLGNMVEVRTGSQTQDLPIFVRMLDKDSVWGYDNGLKSVITTSLVMSILGYPFILPDMIGGNAYIFDGEIIDFESELIAYPDSQLFVRWAQVTAFLPSMQYSIPPWHYTNSSIAVNKICKDLIDLREALVYPVLIKEADNAVKVGSPIIRPMWWLDNTDLNLYNISDQFLVGNEILVAPITDPNTYKRDVYLPKGNWKDEYGKVYSGPTLIKDYPAPIEKIPYFTIS